MFIFVIKEIREEKQVDLEDLASETKIPIEQLEKLENNELIDIELSKIYKIAKVLGVSIKDLCYAIDDYDKIRNDLNELMLNKNPQDSQVQRLSKILDEIQNIAKK